MLTKSILPQRREPHIFKFQFIELSVLRTGAAAPMASPGGKLSAKLTDEERRYLTVLFALSLKRYQFTPFYLCISVHTMSLHVAIPHPPLRGTFPSGEGIFARYRSCNAKFSLSGTFNRTL